MAAQNYHNMLENHYKMILLSSMMKPGEKPDEVEEEQWKVKVAEKTLEYFRDMEQYEIEKASHTGKSLTPLAPLPFHFSNNPLDYTQLNFTPALLRHQTPRTSTTLNYVKKHEPMFTNQRWGGKPFGHRITPLQILIHSLGLRNNEFTVIHYHDDTVFLPSSNNKFSPGSTI